MPPPDDKLLISNFCAPVRWLGKPRTLEIDENHSLAQRELEEETGFVSNNWQYYFPGFSSCYSSEIIHFFRAKDVSPVVEA